jgi:hypothetical protein
MANRCSTLSAYHCSTIPAPLLNITQRVVYCPQTEGSANRITQQRGIATLMKFPTIVFVGIAASAAVLAASATACSSNMSASTAASSGSASSSAATSTGAASSSTAAASADYSTLLIKASDITAPGDTFTAQPPTLNPNGKDGVATVFANQNDTREIGDTILVLPDASGANTALDGSIGALGSAVTGGTPQSAQVGSSSTVVSGMSPDGTKSVTLLLFTEGKAFVTLEFDGAPNDPVPPEGVTDVGQKQDAAIKNGLPG